MKFMRKKNMDVNITVRSVMDDEKSRVLCVVGTVEDLLKVGILEYCGLNGSWWLAISAHTDIPDHFGSNRDEAVELFTEAGF